MELLIAVGVFALGGAVICFTVSSYYRAKAAGLAEQAKAFVRAESSISAAARKDYSDFYHKVRAEIGPDLWEKIWRKGYDEGRKS